MPLVVLLLAACTNPTMIYVEPEANAPVTTVPESEPIPGPTKEAAPMINPVPVYQAYIVDQCGTIWGIPANLQGCTQKERIVISEINEETGESIDISSSEIEFFTLGGYVYIKRSRIGKKGDVLDYYRQAIGSLEVEIVDSIPDIPAEKRAILDTDEWLIETVTVNKVERSDIYNRRDIRGYDKTVKGCGPIIRDMVTEFVILDNGILWMSTSGAEFCPNNRLSADQIAEPGRLWK